MDRNSIDWQGSFPAMTTPFDAEGRIDEKAFSRNMDRLLAEGRLLYPGAWDCCTLFDVNFRPSHMTVEELRDGMYWLTERLYSAECVERRRRPFFEAQWDEPAHQFRAAA